MGRRSKKAFLLFASLCAHHLSPLQRKGEGGREGGRGRGSQGTRERGSEGARERGSEVGSEGAREGPRQRASEGARE